MTKEIKIYSSLKAISEELVNLSVKQLQELATVLNGEHGTEPTADYKADVEEQSSFDVILKEVGNYKLQVVKAVKENFHLGLKEAKDLVDVAPYTLKRGVSKYEAENLKKAIEEAGGVAIIVKTIL